MMYLVSPADEICTEHEDMVFYPTHVGVEEIGHHSLVSMS